MAADSHRPAHRACGEQRRRTCTEEQQGSRLTCPRISVCPIGTMQMSNGNSRNCHQPRPPVAAVPKRFSTIPAKSARETETSNVEDVP